MYVIIGHVRRGTEMEKETKYMIIGICTTLFCLGVAIACAFLRKFDIVSIVMLAVVAAFSVFVCVYTFFDLIKARKNKKISE